MSRREQLLQRKEALLSTIREAEIELSQTNLDIGKFDRQLFLDGKNPDVYEDYLQDLVTQQDAEIIRTDYWDELKVRGHVVIRANRKTADLFLPGEETPVANLFQW